MENKETLEGAAENYAKQFDYAEDSSPQIDFIAGANWMEERMYSRQDIIDFVYFINYRHFNKYTVDTDEVDLFIEQLKNK